MKNVWIISTDKNKSPLFKGDITPKTCAWTNSLAKMNRKKIFHHLLHPIFSYAGS